MSWASRTIEAARTGSALYQRYNKEGPKAVIDDVATFLAKPRTSAAVSVSTKLKSTPLKSYLDKNYEKKCGVEVKYRSILPTYIPLGTTMVPIIKFNSLIALGTGDQSQRVGNRLETKSLGIHMQFNTANTTYDTRIKLYLVRQPQTELLDLPASEIMYNPADILSFPNLDKTRSFTILKSWDFTLSPIGVKGNRLEISYWHNPKSCEVTEWLTVDTTGASTNMTKGLISLMAMYQTAGASVPSCTIASRFSYVDA